MKPIAPLLLASALTACATQDSSTVHLEGSKVRYILSGSFADEFLNRNVAAVRYAEAARFATGYRLEYQDGGVRRGVSIQTGAGTVDVLYRNGSELLQHTQRARFSLNTFRKGEDVVLEVACPAVLQTETARYLPFVSPQLAAADVKAICDRATLGLVRREVGEIDVPFSVPAVLASFQRRSTTPAVTSQRTLGSDANVRPLQISIRDLNTTQRVLVTAVPYRNGSKVTYAWEDEENCKPNSRCRFDSTKLMRVRETLTTIAND